MDRKPWKPERLDLEIGLTIGLSLFFCHLAKIEALAVATGALMCVQDSAKATYASSLVRMAGILFGGLLGVVIVVLDNILMEALLFYLLCGAGVVANLLLCKGFGMTHIQARVSTLSLLQVVMVFDGSDRLAYALDRFIGSLAGAVISLAVTFVFGKLAHKQ